jgi:hypothetical protein
VTLRLFIVVAIFVSLFTLSGHDGLAQSSASRDLSRYKKGSSYECEYAINAEKKERQDASLREFLWDNWQKKRLAYCTVSIAYNIDTPWEIKNYYVEPGTDKLWRVIVGEGDSAMIYFALFRVDAETGDLIPEKEARKPEAYRLHFYQGVPEKIQPGEKPSLIL